MKKLALKKPVMPNAQGFIPLMLSILAVIFFIIYLVYLRVAHAGQ